AAASVAITRSLLQSGFSFLYVLPLNVLALFAVLLTPPPAVLSLLLASSLVLSGIARFWPINFFVFALGAIGLGGFMNSCFKLAYKRGEGSRARRMEEGVKERRSRGGRGKVERREQRKSTDNEAALVVLVIGSLFASLIGALP
ncbi:MAG: hypothetical protein SGPRY_009811, partial [Prymnesium sp.]